MERANEGTARGSIESLGRWNEKRDDRAMPHKMGGDVRRAFGKFVAQKAGMSLSSRRRSASPDTPNKIN